MDRPNYITPAGYSALKAEYDTLFATERPALVETIAWAAGNGDRSENAGAAQAVGGLAQFLGRIDLAFFQTGDLVKPRKPHPLLAAERQLAKPRLRAGCNAQPGIQRMARMIGGQLLAADRGLGMADGAPTFDRRIRCLADGAGIGGLARRKAAGQSHQAFS